MAIQISRVGKLITDADGYVTGILYNLEVKSYKDENNKDREQLELVFKVPTTKGTSDKYLWTGLNINSEKTYYPVDANGVVSTEGQYNKLTQLILSLGLLTELELFKDDDVKIDVEALIGRTFKFKVIPQRNKPNLSDIDISSIKLVVDDTNITTKHLTANKV
jgi:hypothetical protein